MANGHGGARPGAGRKSKSLSEKVTEGNPGHRELKVLEFPVDVDLAGQEMPKPSSYLSARQKNGDRLIAAEIYTRTWEWLNERGCAAFIAPQQIEQYAMSVSRWIQCEEAISEFGFLAKHPTTGNAIQSPYVAMSQTFMKQANNIWYQIFQVVKENSQTDYRGLTPHDDVMERLLTARKGIR